MVSYFKYLQSRFTRLFQRFYHQSQVHKEYLQVLLGNHQQQSSPFIFRVYGLPSYLWNYLESKRKSHGIWYQIIAGWHLTTTVVNLPNSWNLSDRSKTKAGDATSPVCTNQCQSHCDSLSTAARRDSQVVRREIAKALSNSFPVHSLTIQMEPLADQDPDCRFCEDPLD